MTNVTVIWAPLPLTLTFRYCERDTQALPTALWPRASPTVNLMAALHLISLQPQRHLQNATINISWKQLKGFLCLRMTLEPVKRLQVHSDWALLSCAASPLTLSSLHSMLSSHCILFSELSAGFCTCYLCGRTTFPFCILRGSYLWRPSSDIRGRDSTLPASSLTPLHISALLHLYCLSLS